MNVQIVSFYCTLKNKMGKVISQTFNHDVITYAEGQSELLSGLAEGLQNLTKGEKRQICLSAEQAYGFYDPQKVVTLRRDELPKKNLQNGDQVLALTETGQQTTFRVVQTNGELITLDGNHPLAGQDLVFEIEAVDAREATPEEIAESNTSEVEPAPLLH